jgi:hypothetical protein
MSACVFGFMALFFFSCDIEKNVPGTSGWGQEYFPLEGNSYRIYDVNKIDYSILGNIDSARYYLKEVVSDSFLNLNNEYSYVLGRYKKSGLESEWALDSVWTATRYQGKVVVTENNVPYIKLVFPVLENKKWDGNMMNGFDEEKYTMGNIGRAFTSGKVNHPATLSILQKDNPDTLLVREKKWEVYGKNIGLIYKEIINVRYCSELSCIGEGIIVSGNKYRQELVEYGKD